MTGESGAMSGGDGPMDDRMEGGTQGGRKTRGLLVFDLDGTLFRGDEVTVSAVWETADRLGLPRPSAEKICSFFGRPVSEFHEWLRGLAQTDEETMSEAFDFLEEKEIGYVPEKGRLYDGVPGVLRELKEERFHIALCSNGRRRYVYAVLEGMGILSYFDPVRYRRDEDGGKEEMVGDVARAVPVRPAIVIGDRHDDVGAAKANGFRSIAAAYGFGSEEEIEGADAIVRSAEEIPAEVRRLVG